MSHRVRVFVIASATFFLICSQRLSFRRVCRDASVRCFPASRYIYFPFAISSLRNDHSYASFFSRANVNPRRFRLLRVRYSVRFVFFRFAASVSAFLPFIPSGPISFFLFRHPLTSLSVCVKFGGISSHVSSLRIEICFYPSELPSKSDSIGLVPLWFISKSIIDCVRRNAYFSGAVVMKHQSFKSHVTISRKQM